MKIHPKIKEMSEKLNRPKEEFQMRFDGRCEWVCEHGVGHTVWAPKEQGEAGYTHGCDGCCSKLNTQQEENDKSVESKGLPNTKDEASTADISGDGESPVDYNLMSDLKEFQTKYPDYILLAFPKDATIEDIIKRLQ